MAACSVCQDEITNDNPLYCCMVCNIQVHKYCYGIDEPMESWKCSPCRLGKCVSCQLCFQKSGAMKQTKCKRWAHVICALFTSGVTFVIESKMEPIDISKLSSSKQNKACAFCYNSRGYSSLCSQKKCKLRLHITCAQKKNCLKEIIDPRDDTIKFRCYCMEHKPKDASRRVSNELIRATIRKKRKLTHDEDSRWILEQIQTHSTPINASKKTSSKSKIVASLFGAK